MKPLLGLFWLCVMFATCFSCVHITLSILHPHKRKTAEKEIATSTPDKNEKPKPDKSAEPDKNTPEPVYFIVEKTRRKKSSYSKPKRIKFE